MHILAAVNEYSNSEVAARYAVRLAETCHASLSLIFVAPPGISREVLRHAEAALERLFLEAETRGVEVESLLRTGEPFSQIAALVAERNITLVFAATRHEDISRRYFLRSLGQKLLRRLPCGVALVRVVHPGRIAPRKILVPCRGRLAHPREKAFFVARLAKAYGAQVTLLQVSEPLLQFFSASLPPKALEVEKLGPELEQFAAYLEEEGVFPSRRLGHGPAGRAITVDAAWQRNDLIIMGASERGLWESLTGGNPVEAVLRETPCNLIIFKPGRAQP